MNFLTEYYLWIKSAHIIFVICWMAGLLYLPRIFVYHSTTKPRSEASSYFLTMEEKLLKIIMLPSIILVFISGIILLITPGAIDKTNFWIHLKLFLVLILAGFHGSLKILYNEFLKEKRLRTSKFFRIINEVPALILIGIVLLVILKPF